MPYENVFVTEVLNLWLADGYEASGKGESVLEWLGEEGKTLADMLGQEASDSFYTRERKEELSGFIAAYDLRELQYYLNDNDAHCAVVLGRKPDGTLVFKAGDATGTPAISTDWFEHHRSRLLS